MCVSGAVSGCVCAALLPVSCERSRLESSEADYCPDESLTGCPLPDYCPQSSVTGCLLPWAQSHTDTCQKQMAVAALSSMQAAIPGLQQ